MPIDSQACPGPCNNRARRDWEAYEHDYDQYTAAMDDWLRLPDTVRGARPAEPEQPTTPVTWGEPVWSPRCAAMVAAALRECDELAASLYTRVDGHRGAAMRGPNGVPAPDHKAIINELDRLYGILVAAKTEWCRVRGYTDRPLRGRGSHARTVTVEWLADRLDDILLVPGSARFGLDILAWQRRLRVMAQEDPVTARSAVRCPRCGERSVGRSDHGAYEFECRACGRLLTEAEHDRVFAEQAEEHDHEQRSDVTIKPVRSKIVASSGVSVHLSGWRVK